MRDEPDAAHDLLADRSVEKGYRPVSDLGIGRNPRGYQGRFDRQGT